jgi:hypothetical protein
MTTKELIEAEIEHLDEEQLDELYRVVQELAQSKKPASVPSLMARLKQVRIEAPEDFAVNFDLYASGEKRV